MTYRGVVQNGVVVLENGTVLPDGTPVEVTQVIEESTLTYLPAFGLWRDRADFADSTQAAIRLREESEQRYER